MCSMTGYSREKTHVATFPKVKKQGVPAPSNSPPPDSRGPHCLALPLGSPKQYVSFR